MTATMDDTQASDLEVRIYDHDHLVGRECCASEEAIGEIVDRWSDAATLFVVADHSAHTPAHTPGPPSAPLKVTLRKDQGDGCPLALLPLPDYGTE